MCDNSEFPQATYDAIVAGDSELRSRVEAPFVVASFIFETLNGENDFIDAENRPRIAVPREGHMTSAEQLVSFAYDGSGYVYTDTLTRGKDGKRFFYSRNPGNFRTTVPLRAIVGSAYEDATRRDEVLGLLLETEHWQGIVGARTCQLLNERYVPNRPHYVV